ncbi:MAG: hypothetical protein JWR52_2995 [Marmoricola sp.]|nr:hypothetical protein [Marmoricola sp.]
MDTTERTLYPSRKKWALMFSGSVTFVIGGVLMAVTSTSAADVRNGWLCVAFFGLCAFAFGVFLIPGSAYLHLSSDGYDVRSFFWTRTETWDHIVGFVAVNLTGTTRLVGVMYAENYSPRGAFKLGMRLGRRFAGVESYLPDTYGMPAPDLAELMNEYRERHERARSNRED